MSKDNYKDIPVEEIRAWCKTQPIERLSKLGEDFHYWLRPNTDIGFVVDYVPGETITLLDMAGHEIDLGEILGVGVVVHTSRGLRGGQMSKYVDGARLLYERQR